MFEFFVVIVSVLIVSSTPCCSAAANGTDNHTLNGTISGSGVNGSSVTPQLKNLTTVVNAPNALPPLNNILNGQYPFYPYPPYPYQFLPYPQYLPIQQQQSNILQHQIPLNPSQTNQQQFVQPIPPHPFIPQQPANIVQPQNPYTSNLQLQHTAQSYIHPPPIPNSHPNTKFGLSPDLQYHVQYPQYNQQQPTIPFVASNQLHQLQPYQTYTQPQISSQQSHLYSQQQIQAYPQYQPHFPQFVIPQVQHPTQMMLTHEQIPNLQLHQNQIPPITYGQTQTNIPSQLYIPQSLPTNMLGQPHSSNLPQSNVPNPQYQFPQSNQNVNVPNHIQPYPQYPTNQQVQSHPAVPNQQPFTEYYSQQQIHSVPSNQVHVQQISQFPGQALRDCWYHMPDVLQYICKIENKTICRPNVSDIDNFANACCQQAGGCPYQSLIAQCC